MEFLTLDAETFYSDDYTLSKMNTEAYIRDSRFEEILWSIKFGAEPAIWVLPDRFDYFVKNEVDWPNTALICHHSHFDGAILSWHHGIKPGFHIDTLSMARVLDGPKASNSLEDLVIRHGVGRKGDYIKFAKGKRSKDFTPAELRGYGEYCCNDGDKTYALALKFLPQLPLEELRLIDLTIRMFTEPVFKGDVEKLRGAVVSERYRKKEILARIGLLCSQCGGTAADILGGPCKSCEGSGLNKKPLNSSDQFADLLRAQGVEPETKVSPTSGEPIYAFARTDSAMQSLLEDEEEPARVLPQARIAVKSNIIESRAERFAGCAERGPMPVYISHAGAHTLRPSGGDKMNWLNMSKKNATRPEMMVLRQSIRAPAGYKIVTADSWQGEARIIAWLAGQQDLVDGFAQGRDIYSEHASTIYERPVDRKRVKEDEIPGQLGKVSILGMGFGMGWFKAAGELLKGMLGAPPIQLTIKDMETLQVEPSAFLNNPRKIAQVDAMPSRLELNDRLIHCIVTEALVQRYRQRYPHIPAYWGLMNKVITCMITGEEITFGAHGIMRAVKEGIMLPNGMRLNYRGIERDDAGEASYWDGRKRTKIHGALLTENTVQCLHRLIVAEQMLDISDAGIKVVMWPYDEVVAVVPDDAAPVALEFMLQTMKKAPSWAVGLPLAGEGGIGQTYAEAR